MRTMRGQNEHVKKKQKQVTAENATLRLRSATLERGLTELREQNAIATARIKELEVDNVKLSSVNQKLQTVADMCNKGTAGEAVAENTKISPAKDTAGTSATRLVKINSGGYTT